jgi:hypothetical protein
VLARILPVLLDEMLGQLIDAFAEFVGLLPSICPLLDTAATAARRSDSAP